VENFRSKTGPLTCHRITITGVNPKTNEVKFLFEDGEKSAHARFGGGWNDFHYAKPMTDAEIAEWGQLRAARDVASDAFDKFVKQRQFKDVHQQIQSAVESAADAIQESEETGDPRLDAPARKRKRG